MCDGMLLELPSESRPALFLLKEPEGGGQGRGGNEIGLGAKAATPPGLMSFRGRGEFRMNVLPARIFHKGF